MALSIAGDGVDVGVDLAVTEDADELEPSVVLAPDEVLSPRGMVETWTAKEAMLKLAGVGLSVDPHELVAFPSVHSVNGITPSTSPRLAWLDWGGAVLCIAHSGAPERSWSWRPSGAPSGYALLVLGR